MLLQGAGFEGCVPGRDAFYGKSQETQLIDAGVYISLLSRSLE